MWTVGAEVDLEKAMDRELPGDFKLEVRLKLTGKPTLGLIFDWDERAFGLCTRNARRAVRQDQPQRAGSGPGRVGRQDHRGRVARDSGNQLRARMILMPCRHRSSRPSVGSSKAAPGKGCGTNDRKEREARSLGDRVAHLGSRLGFPIRLRRRCGAVWVASSLAAHHDGPLWATLLAGLLCFPLLPVAWELASIWRHSAAAQPAARVFTTFDRLVLRTLAINGVFA